ncbi:MAG: hypothetical protein K1X74_18770 [Pirellulales bacterium]|nr:hypothetical protein [Pirellulales bacterium]
MVYRKQVDADGAEVRGPACLHLRSKGMYVTGLVDPTQEGSMGDGYCWCNRTQNVLGPDDQLVDRPNCQAGRGCFQQVI